MYLSKLEIFGFKSFADKTVIDFDSGVSAIVGPNGSGKSNIVDALRWVLGEQGDKILRSGKREDVVFNGTKYRKPLSVAEVAVTIQNDKGILPTEYSEVQIARRFYRSGETEYFLNGVRVRLKDIRELFIDTGIGPDAYSVIELKMVETILSDVKHERRKLFEEAAGVVSYKHNRDLTFNRLDAVRESLLRVNDIIREKQRNVNALERQVKRNEEARMVSEELKSLELMTSKYEYEKLLIESDEIKSKEGSNISHKEKLASEISENDSKLDAIRAEVKQLDAELATMSAAFAEESAKIEKIERENLVAGEKANSLNNNIARLESEIETLRESLEKNSLRKSEIEEKLKVLNHTIYVSEGSLNEKKAKVDASVSVINVKKNEIMEFGKKLKDANQRTNAKKSEYEKAKLKFENNLSELEKLTSSISSLLQLLNELENEKEELSELHDRQIREFEIAVKDLNSATERISNLNAKIEGSQRELNEKSLEHQKLKSKSDYLSNLSDSLDDFSEGVRYLVKQEVNGRPMTIIESIEVEERFRIAIETALGEISNYLITGSASDAEQLISQLEEKELGKVTFILNDIITEDLPTYIAFDDYVPEFIGTKGVFGFADKFVKCTEEKYSRLIKFILDEYVIVDKSSTARELAQDSYYKFITLDGDIYTRGVIRAGSKTNEESVRLGRAGVIAQLVSQSEAIEIELSEIRKSLEILTKEKEAIPESDFRERHENLRVTTEKTRRDIENLEFRKLQLDRSIAENEKLYGEISEANKSISNLISELIEEVGKCENEHANLDKELIFLTEEFDQIEQQFSQDQSDYNSYNIEYLKLKNELRNEESNLNRLISSITHSERRFSENVSALQNDRESLASLLVTISRNDAEIESLKSEAHITKQKLDTIKKQYETSTSLQHSTDVEQRQRRIDFDSISQKLINSQIKIKENEIKSEQIRDYILKKYEKDISIRDYISGENNDFNEFDYSSAKLAVDELTEKLKKLGGGYQQILFEDFENEKEELKRLIEQKDDLLESEKDIRKTIDRINREARERFIETFEKIRENFIMIFKQLFSEGDEANLRIVYEEDEEGKQENDPLEAKIEITAKPRGKRPTSIELLSGGEKTLTAIALLFAIYLVKPSPFCVLDEVDAPLDVANLGRFNRMIRKFSEKTQFVLITHNERTMESVDRLYGVTMQEAGVTTIVETKFKKDEKLQA